MVARLPLDHLSPESTEDREGFLHPYHFAGGVGEAELRMLLRDFDSRKLDDYERLVQQLAREIEIYDARPQDRDPAHATISQHGEFMTRQPLIMDLAETRLRAIEPTLRAQFLFARHRRRHAQRKACPTPNLSVGQHNIHSVLEFVSLDEIVAAVEHLVALLDLWQRHGRQ